MNPVHSIVQDIFEVGEGAKALVVFDTRSSLSRRLTDCYREALPAATFISFDDTTPEDILSRFAELETGDFVALIQSGNFRLNEFRIRVELFKKGLKVIEHPHLDRMINEEQVEIYINALEYDKDYYRGVGHALKAKIDNAKSIVVESGKGRLVYEGPFEDAKLNIGDYTGMKNWGGQFPIGEVFTEPSDLSLVNGTAELIAFGDRDFNTNVPENRITVVIEKGIITEVQNSNPEFDAVIAEITAEEALVQIRELGLGMNRAMTREKIVKDIGTYERMCGVHMSLGSKHTIYAKKEFSRKHSRFHVDVFVGVTRVLIDNELVFENGQYVV
jgi:aminopeptidase